MAKWDEQLTFEEVKVGDELPELALPLTVQRLVMEAAANRDFVPLHHDDAAAQSVVCTFFVKSDGVVAEL